ncbi:SAM-dependent methyltransferase [Paracoccus sp. MBLB3053]|uniref:SAM-dependent methyltransferase n=1 Tax=Paracoccus aurantius TaxID=3073814 RepID=A0ABU2HNI8_9RHOB|nr:SAM-dependent methyltransferase [Paracoccus sp. MBLB3053]MDS9466593.1 SAM-dependent methyltransferase [Paracoccus sp. MBLB3053]
MIDLTLIGIGTGSPGHLTREAIAAMENSDLILIPVTPGEDTGTIREGLCHRVLVSPPRIAPFPAIGAADAIAAQLETILRATAATRPCVLVWGDPTLQEDALTAAQALSLRTPLHLRLVPGITAIQALCAAHLIPVSVSDTPGQIVTGRQLREHGWPESVSRIIVIQNDENALQEIDPEGVKIWWGAYLGMPEQMLRQGPLGAVGAEIIRLRRQAHERHGWIADCCLLERRA